MTENKVSVETHGCIVCGRTFSILAVYTPGGKLVDCTVTSPGGQIVPDAQKPLAACDSHTVKEVEAAYNKWRASIREKLEDKEEDQ